MPGRWSGCSSRPRESRRELWPAIRAELGAFFPFFPTFRALRDVRRSLRRASRIFAEEGAGAGASLWFNWRLHWQWAALPGVVALLGILVSMGMEQVVRMMFIMAIANFAFTRLRRL